MSSLILLSISELKFSPPYHAVNMPWTTKLQNTSCFEDVCPPELCRDNANASRVALISSGRIECRNVNALGMSHRILQHKNMR